MNKSKYFCSLQHQLSAIFSSHCYTAMGIRLTPAISTNLYPLRITSIPNNHHHLQYSINIANQVYKHYQNQNFRFSDHGTTPKIIAQQIEAHFKSQDNIQYEINEFGVFKVKPTSHLLQKIFTIAIKQPQNLEKSLLILENQRINPAKVTTKYIDFIIGQSTTLNDILRLLALLARSRIRYHNTKIKRRVFIENNLDQQLSKICIQLFDGDQVEVIYHNGLNTINFYHDREPTVQYSTTCKSEQSIVYENTLPRHYLHKMNDNPKLQPQINILYDQISLSNITAQNLITFLNQHFNMGIFPLQHQIFKTSKSQMSTTALYFELNNFVQNQGLKYPLSSSQDLGSIIINFYDMLNNSNFVLANFLIQYLSSHAHQSTYIGKIIEILKSSLNQCVQINVRKATHHQI